jgi:phage baseplate assembly protein gpV
MKQFLLLVALMLMGYMAKAQTCSTCTVNITGYDTLNYTVNAGETFCIDTLGHYEGHLIMNGGMVCNKGLFKPKSITLTSGTIDNYANSTLPAAVTLSANRILNNKADAILNINGGVTVSGGTFTNNGIINVSANITNSSGTVTNTGILNCLQLTGSNTVNNTGVINTN